MNFQHHIQPPAALAAPLPDVGQLPAFYATMGGVLLYHDANTGDAARCIAPPAEWPTLQEAFEGWTEHLSDEEREEILPDWIEHCQVIGETPHSGNYILMATLMVRADLSLGLARVAEELGLTLSRGPGDCSATGRAAGPVISPTRH